MLSKESVSFENVVSYKSASSRRIDGEKYMNTSKIMMLILAVAGIAMLISGCGTSDYRTNWAQNRCDRVMAQARLDAVQELLAAGHVDYAQKVLQQYLPEAGIQGVPQLMLAAEDDEDDKEEAPSQYAQMILESDLEPEAQTW